MIKFLRDLQASSTPSELQSVALDGLDILTVPFIQMLCAFPRLTKINLVFSDVCIHEYYPRDAVKNIPGRKIEYYVNRLFNDTRCFRWNGSYERYNPVPPGFAVKARSMLLLGFYRWWVGSAAQLAGLQILPIDVVRA